MLRASLLPGAALTWVKANERATDRIAFSSRTVAGSFLTFATGGGRALGKAGWFMGTISFIGQPSAQSVTRAPPFQIHK